jgi:hypothetical protein
MRMILIAALLAGCTTWRTINEYDQVISAGDPVLRTETFIGHATATDDGAIEVAMDLDQMCRYATPAIARHVIVRRRVISTAGWVAMFLGLGLEAGGKLGGAGVNPVATLVAILGAAIQVVPPLALATQARRDTTTEDHPMPGSNITSCLLGGVKLGNLTMTTPWGVEMTSPIDILGNARFYVDWRDVPTDDETLFGRYRFHLDGGERSGAWTPHDTDRNWIRADVRERRHGIPEGWQMVEGILGS